MNPKTRLPKHVREWLSESDTHIAEVQHPEMMMAKYKMLLEYFMEKYEEEKDNRKKASKRANDYHEAECRGDLIRRHFGRY